MAIFCEKCGYQNSNSAKFCRGCGGEVIATASDGTLSTGVVLDNRYEIKRLIKSGGMGAVYEGIDRRFENRPCAVKEMLNLSSKPEEQEYFIDRFKKEALILHDLKHPNLPSVKDHFVEGGRYYLVMEYIEGKDLDSVMRSYGIEGVPEDLVIKWAKEILSVLSYLHNQSPPIVYRDLKPANVMLRISDERLFLIDFGIARTMTPGTDSTKTGIGTPVFAPKELLMGKPEIRSDIYCMGATMHCLLTGMVPVMPGDFSPVRTHKPYVSGALDDIVMCALSMNPEDRYQSAEHMKGALENMANKSLTPTVPAAPVYRPVPTVPAAPVQRPVPTVPSAVSPLPSQTAGENFSPLKTSQAQSVPPASPAQIQRTEGEKERNKILIPAAVIIVLLLIVGGVLANNYYNNPARYLKIAEDAGKNYITAKTNYEKVLALDKENVKALMALADIVLDNAKNPDGVSDPNSAIDYYKRAVELSLKNKDMATVNKASEQLFPLYINKKDYNSAKELLDNLYLAGEIKVDEYIKTGEFLMKDGKYKLSADCYQKAGEKKPDNKDILKGLSKSYKELNDYEKVLLYGKKLTELFPSDKDGFIYAGEASYKLTDYNGANKYFKRAMELKPDASEKKSINSMSFNCYLTLGKNYLSGKKYAEAEKNFNEAKKIDSKNKDLKSGLADCYLEKGKTLYLAGDYSGACVCFNNIKNFNIGGKVTTQADDYLLKIADATKSSESVYIDNNTGYYNSSSGSSGGSGDSGGGSFTRNDNGGGN